MHRHLKQWIFLFVTNSRTNIPSRVAASRGFKCAQSRAQPVGWRSPRKLLQNHNTMKEKEQYTVLPSKLGGGPQGLGDPNDRSLRKVEKDILIPQLIRDRTKTEKCVNEVKDFNECCKNSGLMLVLRCRKENEKMKECMKEWYFNEDFIKECTEQYLNERSEYRNTGIPKKRKNAKLHTTL